MFHVWNKFEIKKKLKIITNCIQNVTLYYYLMCFKNLEVIF